MTQQLTPTTPMLKPSPTLAINEKSKQLIKEGKTVYKLGFGQSPFPVPEEVVDELKNHAFQKDYLPVQGLDKLRDAVAIHYQNKYDLSIDATQVMVGPGSKELIFLTQLATKYSLLLPAPSWVSYEPQANMIGNKVHWIPTQQEDDWCLTAKDLAAACEAVDGSKLLILNYPNNPVGNGYDEAQISAIAEVARQHDLLIISDEIYSLLTFSGTFKSMAHYYPEGTIVSSGLSKWCGAGGWRLGTFVFPKEKENLRKQIQAMASETFSCVSAPVQYAAIKAFEGSHDIDTYLEHSKQILSYVSTYVWQHLQDLNITCPKATGGFYLFPSFDFYKEKLNQKGIYTSDDLCYTLLEETGIALLPGTAFGRPKNELTARLAYVDFDGKSLLSYLKNGNSLSSTPDFFSQYFPKINDSMFVLSKWTQNIVS